MPSAARRPISDKHSPRPSSERPRFGYARFGYDPYPQAGDRERERRQRREREYGEAEWARAHPAPSARRFVCYVLLLTYALDSCFNGFFNFQLMWFGMWIGHPHISTWVIDRCYDGTLPAWSHCCKVADNFAPDKYTHRVADDLRRAEESLNRLWQKSGYPKAMDPKGRDVLADDEAQAALKDARHLSASQLPENRARSGTASPRKHSAAERNGLWKPKAQNGRSGASPSEAVNAADEESAPEAPPVGAFMYMP